MMEHLTEFVPLAIFTGVSFSDVGLPVNHNYSYEKTLKIL